MNFSFLPQFWSYFNYGVLVTIMISVCVVFFGTILGVLVSLAKRSGIKPLEWLVSLYVWVFRGTPMVVQIMIAFNLIHMNLPTVQFGILNHDTDSPKRLQYQIQDTPTTVKESLFSIIYSEKMIY